MLYLQKIKGFTYPVAIDNENQAFVINTDVSKIYLLFPLDLNINVIINEVDLSKYIDSYLLFIIPDDISCTKSDHYIKSNKLEKGKAKFITISTSNGSFQIILYSKHKNLARNLPIFLKTVSYN